MSVILVLVFFSSLLVIPVGLINPRLVAPRRITNPTRKLVFGTYGSVAIVSFILVGVTGQPQTSSSVRNDSSKNVASTPSVIKPSTIVPTPHSFQSSPATISNVQPQSSPSNINENSNLVYASNGAGLGDSLQGFEKVYGVNAGDERAGRYQNDYIHIIYQDGRVYMTTLQFSNTQESRRNSKDALAAAQPFLPSDAIKIKEWQKDSQQYVIQYESKQLSNAYSAEMRRWLWEENNVKPGTIVLILEHDEFKPESIYAVYISPGDPGNI